MKEVVEKSGNRTALIGIGAALGLNVVDLQSKSVDEVRKDLVTEIDKQITAASAAHPFKGFVTKAEAPFVQDLRDYLVVDMNNADTDDVVAEALNQIPDKGMAKRQYEILVELNKSKTTDDDPVDEDLMPKADVSASTKSGTSAKVIPDTQAGKRKARTEQNNPVMNFVRKKKAELEKAGWKLWQ